MIDNLTEAIAHYKERARNYIETLKPFGDKPMLEATKKYIARQQEFARKYGQLAAWLTELAERREADRWRPISEPPKEHDYYLVTCEFEVARGTDIALFYPDREGEEQWSLNYVTAWKPLPEPYESEKGGAE